MEDQGYNFFNLALGISLKSLLEQCLRDLKCIVEPTFTTSLAASSAGKPRHDFAAISDDNASQIPSEAIISLPPALESCIIQKKKRQNSQGTF